MHRIILSIFLLLLIVNEAGAQEIKLLQLDTVKLIDEVIDDAEFAITERNMRITGRLNIGRAIRERGYEKFPDNKIIMFCSLEYARKMLTLDPGYLNFCPIRITFRDDGEKTIISAPLFPRHVANAELNIIVDKINSLIKEIVEFSAEDWLINSE